MATKRIDAGRNKVGPSSGFYIKGEYAHTRYKNGLNRELEDGESFTRPGIILWPVSASVPGHRAK